MELLLFSIILGLSKDHEEGAHVHNTVGDRFKAVAEYNRNIVIMFHQNAMLVCKTEVFQIIMPLTALFTKQLCCNVEDI